MASSTSAGRSTPEPVYQSQALDNPNSMQMEIVSEQEDDSEDKGEDSLDELAEPPMQANKKRTVEQRSLQKQLQKPLVQQGTALPQKTRWAYYVAQGVKAFSEALQVIQGQNPAIEAATRELLH